ncbi:MAG: hypothetical protein QOG93_1900 [Gaiellaceae bacterium]|jgi:hypothetical protein|nr:hypothetical protein [Gaiellaceae bacterium]MDX6386603.1 hypothetical protein [Gaiellaceae bacterium]
MKLRRLRLHLGLLGLLGVACVVVAHAAAAPAPTLFRLTIVGTAKQDWTYSAPPVAEGGCSRSAISEGSRLATFRSKAPITVRLLGGRILPVSISGIKGAVMLSGANSTAETCGTVVTTKRTDCAPTRRSFRGAAVRLASPTPGLASITSVANVRLAAATCPDEPLDVRQRPLGPATKTLHLPRAALAEKKLGSITLHSSRNQRTTYGSPEQGRLDESGQWTLRFIRIPG